MTQHETDLSWALRELTESIKEIRLALVASSDGRAITSYNAERDDTDRLAAMVTGLQSLGQPLAHGFFPQHGGQLRLAMLEVDGGHLFVVRAGRGTYLGVVAEEGVDQGQLAHQMMDCVRRMGDHLGTTPRHEESPG